MLKNKKHMLQFFSSLHKQSTLYTCGPAVVSMVAKYYKMLDENKTSSFGCTNQAIFELESELFLTKLFHTTEEQGTDAKYMAKQLKKMGCYLDYGQVKVGKAGFIESFPSRLKNLLEEGIPIIVNYTYYLNKKDTNNNQLTIGHFGVIYSINENEIFISDPAAHFGLKLKSEQMTVAQFLKDWISGSGLAGIFLILYPNEKIYKKYKIIGESS